jgi:hypothetical protein
MVRWISQFVGGRVEEPRPLGAFQPHAFAIHLFGGDAFAHDCGALSADSRRQDVLALLARLGVGHALGDTAHSTHTSCQWECNHEGGRWPRGISREPLLVKRKMRFQH